MPRSFTDVLIFFGHVKKEGMDNLHIQVYFNPPRLILNEDEDPKEREVVQKALYLQPAQQVDLLQELQGWK